MAKFSYSATKDGKTLSGTVEASSKENARETLIHQNIHPLSIKEVKEHGSFMKLGGGKVKSKDLVVFTRQLSTMISAGVPLNRSLATLQNQTDNKYFNQIIGEVSKDIEGGAPLADALAKHPKAFNDIYINMVRAGEAGGILEDILKRLAAQVEKDATMRKKIKSAMAYPTVIMSITVIAFFGIMVFIIPKIAKILKDLGGPDAQLPIYTQILLNTSNFMRSNALIIIIIIVVGVYFLRRYIKTPKGRYRFHGLLLRLPVIKTIIVKIALARFARTFASLMSAGVAVLDALQVTGGAIGNLVIEEELKNAAKEVKNGRQLSEPLSKSKYFPAIVSQMLAIGEETGEIDTILIKVADFYEEEVDVVIDGISALIEPIMIVVLGGIVGVIAISVMGPIASLSNNVGG
ncbi:MAG TPA: type II secretion system F family protein [Candidatus Saccharimonadales bacterium]|nr:type II secretion system F family protein [Candidatus Saccharimonadales bacterium]